MFRSRFHFKTPLIEFLSILWNLHIQGSILIDIPKYPKINPSKTDFPYTFITDLDYICFLFSNGPPNLRLFEKIQLFRRYRFCLFENKAEDWWARIVRAISIKLTIINSDFWLLEIEDEAVDAAPVAIVACGYSVFFFLLQTDWFV